MHIVALGYNKLIINSYCKELEVACVAYSVIQIV